MTEAATAVQFVAQLFNPLTGYAHAFTEDGRLYRRHPFSDGWEATSKKVKEGMSIAEYVSRARSRGFRDYAAGDVPDEATMWEWEADGVYEATDGCTVEPDGRCEHDAPSWCEFVLGNVR